VQLKRANTKLLLRLLTRLPRRKKNVKLEQTHHVTISTQSCQSLHSIQSVNVGNAVYLCNKLVSFLAHLAFRPCELLSSLFVRRPSVNISHFNLLLRNHWTNCNQTLVEWFLDGPLSKLCPVISTSNQDGRQAKNRKKGGWNFNCPLLL
jgi:hypothetical protein